VADYRPTSLTHSFAKILTKILANRLGAELHDFISINQATFIKRRCIHDNFMIVQELIEDLHKRKLPSLFIRLDISKAFDTLNWPYLLQIMTHLGCDQRWRNWIYSLWSTTSSCFLLNGDPEKGFCITMELGRETLITYAFPACNGATAQIVPKGSRFTIA
jgi:hypothetical protein